MDNINDQAERHADAGGAEAPVPTVRGSDAPARELRPPAFALREVAGNERREERADVDAHVENRETGVAAFVGRTVEAADHRGDVGLEEAGAEGDEHEAGVERDERADGHRVVAGRDDDAADEDGAARTDEVIRDEAAENREQINAHRVGAVDGGGVLGVEFEPALRGGFRHEQNEQRTHPVVGKTLPHLGEEKRGEAAGVAAEAAHLVERQRGDGFSFDRGRGNGGRTHVGRERAG